MYGLEQIINTAVEAITKRYLNKATLKTIDEDWPGRFTLRMQVAYNVMGWICAVVAGAPITLALILKEPPDMIGTVSMLFILLFFGGGAVLCFLFYRNHQVVFDETCIEVTSPLRKVTTSAWNKIVRTKFNRTTGYLTLIDVEGQKLRVNQHLTGLQKFVTVLENKTGLIARLDV